MDIKTQVDSSKANVQVVGKLNVQSAPELEDAVQALPQSVCDIDIDLAGTDYVSSAGLRVFVAAAKLAASRGGTMRLLHPIDEVMEVLEMTGLVDVLSVER